MNDAPPAGRFASSWLHFLGLCQRTGSCSVKEKGAASGRQRGSWYWRRQMRRVFVLPAASPSAIYHSKKQDKFNTSWSFVATHASSFFPLETQTSAAEPRPDPCPFLSVTTSHAVIHHHLLSPPSFVSIAASIPPSISWYSASVLTRARPQVSTYIITVDGGPLWLSLIRFLVRSLIMRHCIFWFCCLFDNA